MSGFLKLTRRRYKRCRSKDLRPVLVNVNSIMCIQENPYGGSRLTVYVDGLIERVMYVTSAPDEILALIESRRDVVSCANTKAFEDGRLTPEEVYGICAVCEEDCHRRYLASDE